MRGTIPAGFKSFVAGRAPGLLKAARLPRLLWGVLQSPMEHPPGHFYSPILSHADLLRDRARITASPPETLPGIQLNEAVQQRFREAFARTYAELPYGKERAEGLRFGALENPFFKHSDAVVLYSMMRELRPKRVVEVGSGHSSAVMLDTSDRFLDGKTRFTFIDPYPQRLLGLLNQEDRRRHTVLDQRVQEVGLGPFEALEAGDVLFIDSSHVVKPGSDVAWLVFEVLPRLRPGVYVQIHDVFYPFEYPERWIRAGFNWNEAYLVRAFLMYNRAFELVYFSSQQEQQHPDWFRRHMPLCLESPGQGIWLRVRERE